MIDVIQNDLRDRPDIFFWNGAIEKDIVINWLNERDLTIPEELLEFWVETGGGDCFETETILGPFGDIKLGDDLDSINSFHKSKGMPRYYLIFHTGLKGFSAVHMDRNEYVLLSGEKYIEIEKYPTLAAWYINLIRTEFSVRYGLKQL